MNEPSLHRLRWRGQITGPYLEAAIDQQLDDHEIGLHHEIEHEGSWISLEEFLERRARARAATLPAREQSAGPNSRAPNEWINSQLASVAPQHPCSPAPRSIEGNLEAGPPGARPKSLKLFLLLGLFLGFSGAHNFYAGYWGMALIQLGATLCGWRLGLGIFLPWIWAWLELFIVHTDRRGIRMT
jgi:hypothetical protein